MIIHSGNEFFEHIFLDVNIRDPYLDAADNWPSEPTMLRITKLTTRNDDQVRYSAPPSTPSVFPVTQLDASDCCRAFKNTQGCALNFTQGFEAIF